jgi:hypothetical protein
MTSVIVELPAALLAHSPTALLFSESTIEASASHLLGRTDCKKVCRNRIRFSRALKLSG